MPKYSTGSGGGDSGETCELCGAAGSDLRTATVAGAQLAVCADCAEHDDRGAKAGAAGEGERDSDRDRSRSRRTAQNAAKVHDATRVDSEHWEDGAGYDDDQLPYLIDNYGGRLTEARQAAGLQIDELAAELDVPEEDLLALEQSRATQAGVGGSTVAAVESFLDVDLVDQ